MRIALHSPKDLRTILWGAGAIALILGIGRSRATVIDRLTFERAAAENAVRQLAVDEALVAAEGPLREAASRESNRLEVLERTLIGAATPAAGAAGLATLIERSAAAERVRIGSSLTQGDTVFTEDFARVSVRAYATADVQGLTRWLARIEADPRLLAVRELSVSQPEPAADERTPEALRVELVVEALVRRRASGGGDR